MNNPYIIDYSHGELLPDESNSPDKNCSAKEYAMKKTKTLIITAAAVSMFALAACTQTATEDKNVQTTQAQS